MQSILFVTSRPIIGGAQKWTYEQAKLMRNDFNIYLSTGGDGWLTDSLKTICQDMLLDKALVSYSSVRYYIKLIKFVKKYQIDTVVASSASGGVYARLLRVFFPKLHIVYVSHGWSAVYKGGKISQLIERILSYLSSKIVTISQNDYDVAIKILKMNPNKLLLIKNGIYPLQPVTDMKNNTKYTLIMIARFEYPKRQDILVQVAKELPDVDVVFVGGGKRLKDIKQNTTSNVKFLGERKDINLLLHKADLFVLLSDSEGMPLSILEAMSMSKPLLLSNIKSLEEFIDNNGRLTNNKVQDIVQKIKVLKSKDQDKLGINSYRLFNTKYNILNNKDTYLELYENTTHR